MFLWIVCYLAAGSITYMIVRNVRTNARPLTLFGVMLVLWRIVAFATMGGLAIVAVNLAQEVSVSVFNRLGGH